jgi:hypothetical protein
MKLSALLSVSLIGVLTMAANLAYADQPPDQKPSDAAPAAPPADSGPDAATLKKAREAGLKPEVRKGVTVYCWEDADIGSHFKTKKCVDESRLDEIITARLAQRDQLNRGGGNYGAGK